MDRTTYGLIENYMLSWMKDSAHDKEHIYRVLYTALDIASTEENVDNDVLICSCLLHDIGRQEQFEDPSLCHAAVGAGKAFDFLTANGFSDEFARKVSACIRFHRYRYSPHCLLRRAAVRAALYSEAGWGSVRRDRR